MFGVGNGGSCWDGPPIWPVTPLRVDVSPEAIRRAGWQPDGLVTFKVGSYHIGPDGLIDSISLMLDSGPVKPVGVEPPDGYLTPDEAMKWALSHPYEASEE